MIQPAVAATGVAGLDDILNGGLTPNLLYLLEGLGIATGVTLAKVVEASRFLAENLGRRPPGRYLAAVWGETR